MTLQVCPDLEKVVQAAQEANIQIHTLEFVRDTQADTLKALNLDITGNDESKRYFNWLLDQENLMREVFI